MFDPIKLNMLGEILVDVPGSSRNDDSDMVDGGCEEGVGVHLMCDGLVRLVPITSKHQALYCPRCGMRVVISSEVKTYSQLRDFCTHPMSDRETRRRGLPGSTMIGPRADGGGPLLSGARRKK